MVPNTALMWEGGEGSPLSSRGLYPFLCASMAASEGLRGRAGQGRAAGGALGGTPSNRAACSAANSANLELIYKACDGHGELS